LNLTETRESGFLRF